MKKLSVAIFLLALVCCGQGKQTASRRPPNLAGTASLDAYPLSAGGCYLVSRNERRVFVRYLKGAKAISLDQIELSDEDGIYPLADGSAYLIGRRGRDTVVYHLTETKATEVVDVNTLSQ